MEDMFKLFYLILYGFEFDFVWFYVSLYCFYMNLYCFYIILYRFYLISILIIIIIIILEVGPRFSNDPSFSMLTFFKFFNVWPDY